MNNTKNRKYLRWISTLPCIITGELPTVPHHQDKRHFKAMGMKCSDYRAVPLSVASHGLYHDKFGWKLYKMNGINIEKVIRNFNKQWKQKNGSQPMEG